MDTLSAPGEPRTQRGYPVGSFTCAAVGLSDRRPSRMSCCLRAFEEPAFQASPLPKHTAQRTACWSTC